MDPNANLQEQETLITERVARGRYLAGDAARLRELREALNTWLVRGGFEPDWTKAPNASRYYGQSHKATGYGTK
jgi:hypothetical protein